MREMQTKTTVGYYPTLVRTAVIKKRVQVLVRVWRKGLWYTVGGM